MAHVTDFLIDIRNLFIGLPITWFDKISHIRDGKVKITLIQDILCRPNMFMNAAWKHLKVK